MNAGARFMAFLLLVCGFGSIIAGDWLMVAELAAVPVVAIAGAIGLARLCHRRPPAMHPRRKG